MRNRANTLALALLGVLALPGWPVAAQPDSRYDSGAEVDVRIFYDGLAPYGEWVEMPDYGWSWAPRVERGWRPYTRGQWVLTDYGWFWDSDEQFGWAAYHYGRWVNDRYYGWVWVPGTEWAPSWVSWRHGNGYTGWAPLPPRATWQAHVGLTIGGIDIDAFIGADDYSFVQDRAFVDRGIYQRVLPPTQNVTYINVTTNVTHYTVVDQRVVDRGIAVATVERAVGRRLPRARTVDVDRADAPRHARAGELAVFRPEVRAAPERRPAKGWSLVKGDEPPPLLVERRQQRERERPGRGSQAELTAKDVARQRPARRPAASPPQAPGASTQQPRTQRQGLDERHAADQDQQPSDRERRQAIDRQQRDQARQDADKQRAIGRDQQRQADDQKQRDRARQDGDKQRAKGQDQQRLDREQRQAIDQQQRAQRPADPQRAKRDRDGQAQAGKPAKKDAPNEAKAHAKDKGKKKPEVPPAGEKQ